jgi:hypothetical protein
MRKRALTIYAENEEEYKKVKVYKYQEMEKNDQQLEKEKEISSERPRKSILSSKIEEYKNNIIGEIDELSAANKYNV